MLQFGIDVLQSNKFQELRGKHVGLMTNPSAVNRQLISTYDVFRHADEVHLVALFGAEHGFLGAMPDGQAIGAMIDPRTGVPVHSLYGANYRPTPEMLSGIDVMVCDIQDIGVRYYTFLWTITHIVEACGAVGVPVLILDRPNPLGGKVAGGSPLQWEFASLVGRYDIPIQHGMTLGEMVTRLNATENNGATNVNVIPCEGWQRDMTWDKTGLPFIPPSPNMPHFVTALHYPGACLIEGTTLSEGRGTPLPFEVVGAPYIDAIALAENLNQLDCAGVRFRPHSFQPTASKYAGELCYGVQAHIIDSVSYQPLDTWLHVIKTIHDLYPHDFSWLPPHADIYHFDRLIGSDEPRQQINKGELIENVNANWDIYCLQFQKSNHPYYLYE
jgi:uncharacterized protein YbbC (DUF1343 family)